MLICLCASADVMLKFGSEENIWHTAHYNLLAQNITIPGLSPVYPVIHCNPDGSLCQITTGESGKL